MNDANSSFTVALAIFAVSLALFDVAFYAVSRHPELFAVTLQAGG